MSKTYSTCVGMCGERTARGGTSGCRASVQSYEGSIIIENWYEGDILMVNVGTTSESNSTLGWHANSHPFRATFNEFVKALNLLHDIKTGKCSVVRHRKRKEVLL